MTLSPVWIWAICGLVLIIAEMLTFTFVFVFLGIGALLTAITTALGLTSSWSSQVIVFMASSLLSILALRKTAKKLYFGTSDAPSEFLGIRVKVIETIPVAGEGHVLYRGSQWIAYSDSASPISEGEMVEIVEVDGVRLKVRPVEPEAERV